MRIVSLLINDKVINDKLDNFRISRIVEYFLDIRILRKDIILFSQEYLYFVEILLEKLILRIKKQTFTDGGSQTVWWSGWDSGMIFDE